MSEQLQSGFRHAMRRLAATVSVVSTIDNRQWFGMTATAVNSVSVTPPALLVCVNREAATHSALVSNGRFCVNLLQKTQADISRAFGSKLSSDERFRTGNWAQEGDNPPYLVDSQASIFCDVDGQFPYETHTIFIGRVYEVRNATDIVPLIYQDGTYSFASPLTGATARRGPHGQGDT